MSDRWLTYLIEVFCLGYVTILTYLAILSVTLPFVNFSSGMRIAAYIVIGSSILWVSLSIIDKYRKRKDYPTSKDEYPEIHRIVAETADDMDMDKPEVGVVRSDYSGAFATAIRPGRPLVVYREPILDTRTEDELRAVTAHELSHIRSFDFFVNVFLLDIQRTAEIIFNLISKAMKNDILFLIVLYPLYAIFRVFLGINSILFYFVKRTREYRADAVAAEVVSPETRISALEKYIDDEEDLDKSFFERMSGISEKVGGVLFSTHPSTRKRIERIEDMYE